MGLRFYGIKRLGDNISYGQFFEMRVLIATKIDKDLGEIYQNVVMPPIRGKNGIYLKMFREKEKELNVPNVIEDFLFQCDLESDGTFNQKDTKDIYNYFIQNDLFNKCKNEAKDKNALNDLESALKYCVEHNMEFGWL